MPGKTGHRSVGRRSLSPDEGEGAGQRWVRAPIGWKADPEGLREFPLVAGLVRRKRGGGNGWERKSVLNWGIGGDIGGRSVLWVAEGVKRGAEALRVGSGGARTGVRGGAAPGFGEEGFARRRARGFRFKSAAVKGCARGEI